MAYNKASLTKYLNDLSAGIPAPGGGSAAALNAALGSALIGMVCNFTVGKPKYKKFEKSVSRILNKSQDLTGRFLVLVDLDVSAYKSKNINKCLDVPVKVCDNCLKAIRLCPELVTKGNKNLISDVSCAAIMLEAAFFSAWQNVLINLKYLKDKKKKDKIIKYFKPVIKEIKITRERVERDVSKIIGR